MLKNPAVIVAWKNEETAKCCPRWYLGLCMQSMYFPQDLLSTLEPIIIDRDCTC